MITAIDKNTALVLIDFQKGIAKDTVHPLKPVLANVSKLMAAFRKENLPIFVVNMNPMGAAWIKTRKEQNNIVPKGKMAQKMADVAFSISGFTDIVPEIKTSPGDIFITKRTWNAFFNTPLHDELEKRKITGVVLAGISTSIGVEGTARAGSQWGYNITFALDAMTDKVLEAHQNSITYIFPRLGESGSVDEIVEKMQCRV